MTSLQLYHRLHNQRRDYGRGGVQYAREIRDFAERNGPAGGAAPPRVLDFGCGKGELLDALGGFGWSATGYDPAVTGFARWPAGEQFDLVVCTDVLEHLAENGDEGTKGHRDTGSPLERALYLMRSTGARLFFAAIYCAPAATVLADGSNAHATVRPARRWLEYLTGRLAETCVLARDTPPIAVVHGWNGVNHGED